ncbi:MAG: hypothetical protein JSW59_06165 [Phycisphaerales bacterium]|nr:MAG: hypothetical protein JSW59_06165 [Phycisphaerales bacterium]
MNARKLLFYVLAGLMGGCVPVVSLHPLYTKENVVFDKKLLGTWVDDPNKGEVTWQFRSVDEPKKAYNLVFTDDKGLKGSFVTHLVKLGDDLFLDIFPSKMPWDLDDPNESDWPYNALLLIPMHTFVKIDSVDPKLKMRLMLETQLKKLLEENPDAIAHVVVEDRPVLTASTKELQAFVLKYADTDKLFTDQIVLIRRD